MGNCCGKGQNRMRVLLLGLDSAGKTTILYSLKCGEPVKTVPTIGFNIETVNYQGLELNIWDVGGQDKLRDLWRHYYPGTNGIIFVVDSADKTRLNTAKEELHLLMNEHELQYATLVVVANKQDLPNALKKDEVAKALELDKISRKNECFEATAKENKGLTDALDWLTQNMQAI
mmetsp:Transcript_51048/g.45849  ORF Transcript_51048/g.45849 Transcript_51048/m.45849 type:complete len:174 (+) Transcript_51048:153-674(+)